MAGWQDRTARHTPGGMHECLDIMVNVRKLFLDKRGLLEHEAECSIELLDKRGLIL
jgi:hypothetical protein